MTNRYLFANSVADCLEMLARAGGQGRIIAGGTDLMLAMQRGEADPAELVDISRATELHGIREDGGWLWLGAAVTHAQCAASPLIRRRAVCLAEACSSVGSPQIRHMGTVGGNVVNAQPAADAAIALVALGAVAEIASAQGVETLPVESLYAGAGHSRVDSTRQLVTRIGFPLPGAGQATAFLRFSPRKAMALPILNGAVKVTVQGGSVSAALLALGPVAPAPFRPRKAEDALIGASVTDASRVDAAALAASQEATPRDSLLRGSAAYRQELVRVLVRRMVNTAVERAAAAA